MNAKNLFSWFLLIFGEAILIAAFILFKGATPHNILVLNIVVSTLVYALFFINFRIPWINQNDQSQKQIGAIGISWYAVWFYALAAIALMLVANLSLKLGFTLQLSLHCVLLFFLLMGIWFSRHSSDKVKEIYEQETANRNKIVEMKKTMLTLKDKISETAGLPDVFVQRINALEESLRFISPVKNEDAYELERSFVEITDEIRLALSDFSMNEEAIEGKLKKLERICQNRKSIYSN